MTQLKIGILGLGNAASLVLRHLAECPGVQLICGADPQPQARASVSSRFSIPVFESITDLLSCDINAIWIATPTQLHAEHCIAAARAGKHILCEKPIARTLEECDRIIESVSANRVKFMLVNSKLRQSPIEAMRRCIESDVIGHPLQITSVNYNDWLLRPRLATEFDPEHGGGIVYRQAPHQVDIARYLSGDLATTIYTRSTSLDADVKTQSTYTAMLSFSQGSVASLVYNALGYFHISELTWNIGEGGQIRSAESSRRQFDIVPADQETKRRQPLGSASQAERKQPFYGLTIVSCERGILRQSPEGIFAYGAHGVQQITCDSIPSVCKDIAELRASLDENRDPFPDAAWGKATLEICCSMLESSKSGACVPLHYQTCKPFGRPPEKAEVFAEE